MKPIKVEYIHPISMSRSARSKAVNELIDTLVESCGKSGLSCREINEALSTANEILYAVAMSKPLAPQ